MRQQVQKSTPVLVWDVHQSYMGSIQYDNLHFLKNCHGGWGKDDHIHCNKIITQAIFSITLKTDNPLVIHDKGVYFWVQNPTWVLSLSFLCCEQYMYHAFLDHFAEELHHLSLTMDFHYWWSKILYWMTSELQEHLLMIGPQETWSSQWLGTSQATSHTEPIMTIPNTATSITRP